MEIGEKVLIFLIIVFMSLAITSCAKRTECVVTNNATASMNDSAGYETEIITLKETIVEKDKIIAELEKNISDMKKRIDTQQKALKEVANEKNEAEANMTECDKEKSTIRKKAETLEKIVDLCREELVIE